MGRTVYQSLRSDAALRVTHVLESPAHLTAVKRELGEDVQGVSSLHEIAVLPDFAVECAGHAAVQTVVPDLLERGVTCIIASIGSLATPGLPERLEQAALRGGAQLIPVAGALAGIDALAAAREAGLEAVSYVGRKAPKSWLGTAAESRIDLQGLNTATPFFQGSAREAARLFPQNANVAAMTGLSGLGLDRTAVTLIADPEVSRNTHLITASGAFGRMEVKVEALPLSSNPKTSALAAYSIIRQAKLQAAALGF